MRDGPRGRQTVVTRQRIGETTRTNRAAWTDEQREEWSRKRRRPRGFDHRPSALTYSGVHLLMRKMFPKLGRCEWCGGTERGTQYAATRHPLTLNRADWLELCGSCHQAFDGRLKKAWRARRQQDQTAG